jgi:hypothetical protein
MNKPVHGQSRLATGLTAGWIFLLGICILALITMVVIEVAFGRARLDGVLASRHTSEKQAVALNLFCAIVAASNAIYLHRAQKPSGISNVKALIVWATIGCLLFPLGTVLGMATLLFAIKR